MRLTPRYLLVTTVAVAAFVGCGPVNEAGAQPSDLLAAWRATDRSGFLWLEFKEEFSTDLTERLKAHLEGPSPETREQMEFVAERLHLDDYGLKNLPDLAIDDRDQLLTAGRFTLIFESNWLLSRAMWRHSADQGRWEEATAWYRVLIWLTELNAALGPSAQMYEVHMGEALLIDAIYATEAGMPEEVATACLLRIREARISTEPATVAETVRAFRAINVDAESELLINEYLAELQRTIENPWKAAERMPEMTAAFESARNDPEILEATEILEFEVYIRRPSTVFIHHWWLEALQAAIATVFEAKAAQPPAENEVTEWWSGVRIVRTEDEIVVYHIGIDNVDHGLNRECEPGAAFGIMADEECEGCDLLLARFRLPRDRG